MSKRTGAAIPGAFHRVTALNAVTATSTSNPIPVAGARRVSCAFTRADHSAGSSAFKLQGTLDGETWVDLNMLVENLTNTNVQDYVRATEITLSANGTTLAALDLAVLGLLEIRAVVTETTDGTHSAEILIEY